MNHNGDNSPSMDFDELRRRHEEFKQRQGQRTGPAPQKRPPVPPKSAAVQPAADEAVQPTAVQEAPPAVEPADDSLKDLVMDMPEPVPVEVDVPNAHEDGGEYEGDAEDFEEDFEEDGAISDDGSNPFSSILNIFKSARSKLMQHRDGGEDSSGDETAEDAPAKKRWKLFSRKKQEDEEFLDYDDSDYADENYVEEEFPASDEILPPDEPAPIDEPAAPVPAADVEDLPQDAPPGGEPVEAALVDGPDADETFDENDFDDVGNSDEDNDYGDVEDFGEDFDDDEQDAPKTASGFKRFLNLFIVREEEDASASDDAEPEDDWDDADDFEDEDFYVPNIHNGFAPADEPEPKKPVQSLYADTDDIEGGSDMDENNKLNLEMTEQLASSLETQGMTRRERRELAERLAAEEAAKKAVDEAAKRAAEEAAKNAVEEVVQTIAAAPVAEPAVERPMDDLFSVEPVAEPAPAEQSLFTESVDEPTREFKPLSKTTVAAAQSAIEDPFDVDEDDEDEDDEDEVKEKSHRFSLFGRKKNHDEDVEDEDDMDDEDDVDEDEDEDEDEEPEKKPRRGLFSKKSRSAKYDEDEDEDDEDSDEEDEDEYDEYDEYDEDDEDEDEEDYDDYDDDDDGQPLSHHILGFFKWLFFIVLVVLLAVFVLNFLDFFNVLSLDNLFEKHYNKAPAVFDTLFPSHNLKQLNTPGETISAIDPLENEPTAAPSEVPVSAEPTQEATAAPTQAPVSTDAPATSDAPDESGAVG